MFSIVHRPLPRPFLRFFRLRTESRHAPIGFKREARCLSLRPGGCATPEERWYRAASNRVAHRAVAAVGSAPAFEWLAVAGDADTMNWGGKARHPFRWLGCGSSVYPGLTRFAMNSELGEAALHVEGFPLLEHVVAGTREFVRERFGGHDI